MSKILILGVIFGFFVVPDVVMAAPTYSVTPLIIDLKLEARDIVTKDITITNTGTSPVTLYPTVNNISVDDGGTIIAFKQRVNSDASASLAAWIEINRGGLKLPVGESVTRTITFRVHPTPDTGTYYAFVGFGYGRNVDEAKKMVNEGRAPGVVVTVAIEDDKNSLLKLPYFLVDRFITSPDNEGIAYTIDNPGDESLTPEGEIIIYDNKGVEVASLPVNPDAEIIAPGEKKQFKTTAPVEGLFGKYKAYLSVEYGDTQLASIQDTVFFYAFPLKLLLILLGILLLIATVGAIYVHKRYLDDDEDDDVSHLPVHSKESVSNPLEHDIDLRNK